MLYNLSSTYVILNSDNIKHLYIYITLEKIAQSARCFLDLPVITHIQFLSKVINVNREVFITLMIDHKRVDIICWNIIILDTTENILQLTLQI